MQRIVELLQNEEAVTSVEYAVVLSLILMAVLGAIGSFGAETSGLWGGIETDLDAVGFGK